MHGPCSIPAMTSPPPPFPQACQEVLVWELHQPGEGGADLCGHQGQAAEFHQSRHRPRLPVGEPQPARTRRVGRGTEQPGVGRTTAVRGMGPDLTCGHAGHWDLGLGGHAVALRTHEAPTQRGPCSLVGTPQVMKGPRDLPLCPPDGLPRPLASAGARHWALRSLRVGSLRSGVRPTCLSGDPSGSPLRGVTSPQLQLRPHHPGWAEPARAFL